jgi:hypothetical protein
VVDDHSPRTWSLQAKVVDGEEMLFFGDVRKKDNIKVFNLDRKEWEQSILFEKEGPNGIGKMNGFYVHTMDSIFVVNSFGWEVHLMSGNKKLKTYNTKAGVPVLEQITPFTTNNALKGIISDKLIFYGFPEIAYEGYDYHNKVRIIQSIDLKSGENSVGVGYPEEYHNHLWPGNIVIKNEVYVANDRVFVNYPFSDSVYSYDEYFKPLSTFFLPSIEKGKTSNFDGRGKDQIHGEPAYWETYGKGSYWDILVDYKRDLLFRTVSYSKEDPSSFSAFDDFAKTTESNLLIYDLKLGKKIIEIDFEKGEVDRHPMMFIGTKGLYLSKMNDEIEAVDFYLLSFDEYQ